MVDLNRVMLIGRSTTDLEVKKMEQSGNSVVNFTIATNRKYKNKDGNVLEEAEFHRCVAFGNTADILGRYLEKGKRIYVEGRLRTRKWEDTTGNTKFTTEVVVENFIFLDKLNGEMSTEGGVAAAPHVDEEIPF